MSQSIEGLRAAYETTGGIAHFPRMLDKIRLQAAGRLPEAYEACLGEADPTWFDGRVCRFLGVPYAEIAERTRAGGTDEEILQWAFQRGRQPAAEPIEIFTAFIFKRGWRDPASPGLRQDEAAAGLPPNTVATFPDLMDFEEGRPPRYPADPLPYTGNVEPSLVLPELRSPYDTVGGLVFFGRMVDKIRIYQAGYLPDAWANAMGASRNFDSILCRFLGVEYSNFFAEAIHGGVNDEDLLEWAYAHGRRPNDEEILIFNSYLSKRNWRDAYTPRLHFRLQESGMPFNAVLTMFDYLDLDEGRLPRFSWS